MKKRLVSLCALAVVGGLVGAGAVTTLRTAHAEAAKKADAAADIERSARIAAERDALVEALTGAYGLGRRVRRSGSAAERARTAVTARVRDAIRRISEAHPELGRHLRASVRTGTWCSYTPERRVDWQR